MKKLLSGLLVVFLVLSLAGCATQVYGVTAVLSSSDEPSPVSGEATQLSQTNPETELMEPLLKAYYAGQEARAFGMLKKSIFKSMLEGWTGADLEGITNPKWNYDSFASYQILDHSMGSATRNKNLYYCTFSADQNKHGYVVLQYNGNSMGKMSVAETAYPYDLQANLTEIAAALGKTEVDLSTAEASRIKLVDTKKNRSDEVIRITDEKGNQYLCYFGTSSVKLEKFAATA